MIDATSKQPLVLVVEDELLIAETLEITLGCQGFRILGPVATVEDALALIERSRPDMALIDYRLADTTTEALLQPLNERHVPICVLTGYSPRQLPVAYNQCIVLEKPFRVRTLTAALGRLKHAV